MQYLHEQLQMDKTVQYKNEHMCKASTTKFVSHVANTGYNWNYYNIMQMPNFLPLTHKYVFLVDRELLKHKLCEL